jgi:type IV pilus assembly protein PilC
MPVYEWRGKSVTGEIRKGILDAPNPQIVEAYLRRLNITPLKITPKKETFLVRFYKKSVSYKELALFTRQFATLLEAGLPIIKCLNTLAEQQKNAYFKEVIKDIKVKVEGGKSLSEAMAEYPKIFSPLYIQMIRTGEAGGNLDEVLKQLALHLEKITALKAKVKQAMIYPSVILFVTITIISIIMTFVIPKFTIFFREVHKELPLPTQILINISHNFKKFFLIGVGGLILSILGIKYYRKKEEGKYKTDKILLRLPLFGELFHKAAIARLARTLASLIRSGVPLLQAISIAGETSGNKVIEKAMEEIKINVSTGQTIAEPMFYTGVFPYLVVEMVKIGEISGNLEDTLNRVANFYEDEVDRAVNTLSTLIEPILIVILGIVVGGILIALYLPIFQLAGAIGG